MRETKILYFLVDLWPEKLLIRTRTQLSYWMVKACRHPATAGDVSGKFFTALHIPLINLIDTIYTCSWNFD
jgi:hypothetical protein